MTQGKLAELAGTSQPQIQRLETSGRRLSKEWAEVLAPLLHTTAEQLMFGKLADVGEEGMRVAGVIEAGQFRDITLEDQSAERPRIAVARDNRFPRARQYALLVSGDSMDELFPDGCYVTCVDFVDSGVDLKPGHIVHVEREIAGAHLVETTLKEINFDKDGAMVLRPRSRNKIHKPIPVAGDESVEIRIQGLVTGKWEPQVL